MSESTSTSRILKYALIVGLSTLLIAGAAKYVSSVRQSKKCTKPKKKSEIAQEKQEKQGNSKEGEVLLRELTEEERIKKGQSAKSQGNKYFQAGKFEKAISCYTEAIETYPAGCHELAFAYGNRAACFANLHNSDAVIEDCTKALEIDPLYIKALERRAKTFESKNMLSEAIIDATCACIVDEFKSEVIAKKAESILKTLGDLKAQEIITTKIFKLPSKVTIEDYLRSFPKVNYTTKSTIQELDESIKNGTELGECYFQRGIFNVANKNYALALNDFELAVAFGAKDLSEAFHHYGTFLFLVGDSKKALEAFNSSLEESPKNSTSLLKRALLKLEQGDFNALMEDLDLAAKIDPKDPSIPYHRGELFALSNDFEQAIKQYDQAIQLDSLFVNAYTHKARAFLSLQLLSDAKKTLSTLLKKCPNNVEGLCSLGEVCIFESNFDEAEKKFDKALEQAPDNPNIFLGKAMAVLTSTGDQSAAESFLREAIKVDPQFITAHLQLANILVTKDDKEGAIEHFDEAIECARTLSEISSVCALKEATVAQMKVAERYPQLKDKIKKLMQSIS